MITKNEGNGTLLIHVAVGFMFTCFIALILVLNFIIAEERRIDKKIYPNVFIDEQEVGYKTKDEVRAAIIDRYAKLPETTITIYYQDAPVATLDAQLLSLSSNTDEIIDKAYLVGRSSHISSRVLQKAMLLFRSRKYHFETDITYDLAPVHAIIATLEEEYNVPPKNALFTFENNRVTSFRKEEKGLSISSNKLLQDIQTAIMMLRQNPGSKRIMLGDSVVSPEITLAQANDYNIEELIGEGRSDFSHSIPDRIHNIELGASKFHGVLIPKDSVFSFNDIVGDISAHTGYKPSYIIKAGRTVLGDGGGICQVSTTLFRAAINTGLPIVERHAHAYRVSYYENDMDPGYDATIFSPTVDLKFKNNTPGAILIQSIFDKSTNHLTYQFYGKKDNRSVSISKSTISNYQPPLPALYQDDPTLKKGIVKQVDYPASGARATFGYKVTMGDTVLEDTQFISNYRPWQAVYLVGIGE